MNYTHEIADLFRIYCDEPDQSFLTDAMVAQFCKLGYDEFLQIGAEYNPGLMAGTLNLDFIGQSAALGNPATIYMLNQVVLGFPNPLGATPTDAAGNPMPRINKLVSLLEVGNAPGQLIAKWSPVTEINEMVSGGNQYMYTSGLIILSAPATNNFILLYSSTQDIGLNPVGPIFEPTWANVLTAPGQILSMSEGAIMYHDLIPLLAYGHYAIINDAPNENVLRRLAIRKEEYILHLTRSIPEASMFVTVSNIDASPWT